MSGYAGVGKIVRFNWPWYAVAAVVTVVFGWLSMDGSLTGPWPWLVSTPLVLADLWLLASLVVSHVVYDRSGIARGEWLQESATRVSAADTVAIFHFGQDEASELVAQRLPAAQRRVFDLYDAQRSGSPSLRRARAESAAKNGSPATSAPLDRLPLADGSVALGVLAFAAHEVRDEGARVAMFRDLGRVLGGTGHLLVVEHLRDGWNLLAYGPGVFHFLSRRTWLSTFARAGLQVVRQTRHTPWVCCFELRRTS